jgi:hypothetical protein
MLVGLIGKLAATLALLLAVWGLSKAPTSEVWMRPEGSGPRPVRIIRFYASTGLVTPGQKATLCYGVENARKVRISPAMEGVYPSLNHCLEIVPEHTTHYTLLAEGYDGKVATQSFTISVQTLPVFQQEFNYALATRPLTITSTPRAGTRAAKAARA